MRRIGRYLENHPRWTTALAVAAFVLAGHAWSLDAGLFLDDHAHYRQLKQGDWSFQSAVDSSRLGIVGDVMDLWSHHEAGLRFFRPVAFWIMRAEYTLADWQPAIVHAFSLAWHWIAGMLVAALAFRCLGSRFWAAIAACLFVVHPAQVPTVYWIATQTEIFVVIFILAATLCYARFSRWPMPLFADRFQRAACQPETGHVAWLLAALALFALAIGCRENAVAFPVIVFGTDLITGRYRLRSRWAAYLAIAIVVGLYALLRNHALGGFPLPGRPYLIRPTDPGFFAFIIDKIMYYLLGLFAFFPVIPIGGLAYMRQHPTLFYGAFAVLLVIWSLIAVALRRHRGVLFAVLWIGCAILPVLPVFASAHHLYLLSVGAILLLTAALAKLAGLFADDDKSVHLSRKCLATVLIGVYLGVFTLGSWAFGWAYRIGTSTEDLLVQDIANSGRTIRPGDHFFFVNLPMLAYYAIPTLEERLNVRPLHGHVLTFSPNFLYPEIPTRLQIPDANTLEVAVTEDAYFAGPTGKALLQMMDLPTPLTAGRKIEGPLFTTNILDLDSAGIKKLRFHFKAPLTTTGYHFFLCSNARMAYPIDTDSLSASHQNNKQSAAPRRAGSKYIKPRSVVAPLPTAAPHRPSQKPRTCHVGWQPLCLRKHTDGGTWYDPS